MIYANDEFTKLLEKNRGDFIGKPISKCELWLDLQSTFNCNQLEKWAQLKLCIKERKEYQFSTCLLKPSGRLPVQGVKNDSSPTKRSQN